MEKYDPKKIEKKWQKKWQESGLYKDYSREKKLYALDMFPYPSGTGLHVGHPKGYIATDVFARFKMLEGHSVLHPMGWDAFGLPAENYAIEHKIHPESAVRENIQTFKAQLEKFGFTYDWDREINTTDPEYYKWTQWIFLKMFEKGLAYESDEPINWCPSCKTGLALEDLENGLCERCGSQVVQKKMRQWVLKMTDYADRLLEDLDKEGLDWENSIVDQQKNWIGRSEGALIKFQIVPKVEPSEFRRSNLRKERLEVFTTRLDTIFGCTYCVLGPEHKLIEKLKDRIENYTEVEKYIIQAQNKTFLERTDLQKEKTGIELKGIKVINPFNDEKVPLYVADYILGHYGTGAVMAVPAHDERDWKFAKKYKLFIREVIKSLNGKSFIQEEAFTEDGKLINSGKYSGISSKKAREEMAKWLEEKGIGQKKMNYKMRDWVFSRQRYWGEPIPLIFCPECKKRAENFSKVRPFPSSSEALGIPQGQTLKNFSKGELLNPGWIAVQENELPVKLPKVESYKPTGTGESPLANISEWVNTTCPKCGGPARRETNTMPQWAGSSWYYLAYVMRGISNFQFPISKYKEEFKKWLPVNLYVGGAEHATRHLLYARFWHKFLYDIGVVSTKEPFQRLVHVGLINGEDGRKMSKRWKNVINPNDVIEKFGADSIRLYEMFMGPFTQNIAWSTKGVIGMKRFLDKVWKLKSKIKNQKSKIQTKNKKLEILIHQTIKKVADDIQSFRFNTAISALMILVNKMEKESEIPNTSYQILATILSPFAPHLAEELWEKLGHGESIFEEIWPEYDPRLARDEEITLIIQINGKVRDQMKVPAGVKEDEAKKLALSREKVIKYIKDNTIKKTVFVKDRLVNFVI
ncbi:MAG: leucine--tRNA ligase [Patescibacteria group bacterium]|nr:leucine--tRNA ligase [Patescibacteria group bacterium]